MVNQPLVIQELRSVVHGHYPDSVAAVDYLLNELAEPLYRWPPAEVGFCSSMHMSHGLSSSTVRVCSNCS